MTQEDKELLLKDLCARLPYGVIADTPKGKGHVCDINLTIFGTEIGVNINPTVRDTFSINDVKPYLLPMSSMTEEQKKDIFCNGTFFISNRNELCRLPKHSDDYDYVTIDDYLMIYKKLIENHFDVNGLIPKGLAIDATGLQIY